MKGRKLINFISPLSISFIWHHLDNGKIRALVNYCIQRLQRYPDNPFSRSLNITCFLHSFHSGLATNTSILNSSQHIAFIFLSKEVADSAWEKYIKKMSKMSIKIVPIAIDKSAISARTSLANINIIRLYDIEHKMTGLFIAIAHEVYRFTLNSYYDHKSPGKDNAIQLFLSHTKADKWAFELAGKLKQFIDNTSMRRFFDATDIAPGYRFNKEIEAYLKRSTLISIHSDNYSSRYWCQHENMFAKEKLRPILSIDHLKTSEDRTFPYSANVPVVHMASSGKIKKRDLYRILESALIETLRFFYQKKLLRAIKVSLGIKNRVLVLSRPPESSDIFRLIKLNKGSLHKEVDSILYPEPPVYPNELKFLNGLGIKAFTPLTAGDFDFQHFKVGLSISDVVNSEFRTSEVPSNQIKLFAQDLARHLLARNAKLIYGGDLRKDGFTEFLFSEAAALRNRLPKTRKNISNYISWPIYLADSNELKRWKADYSYLAEMKELQPPKDVLNLIRDKNKYINPDSIINRYIWGHCLTFMRTTMITECDARISSGGRLHGYKGKYPGVLEEAAICISMGKPLYLVGAYGGVTAKICDMLTTGKIPLEFTFEWQKKKNKDYEKLIYEYEKNNNVNPRIYDNIVDIIANIGISGISKMNKLSVQENLRLFQTPYLEEAIFLILTGIKRISSDRINRKV